MPQPRLASWEALARWVDRLVDAYRVVAPVFREQTVMYGEIQGWGEVALDLYERVGPGRYEVAEGPGTSRFRHYPGGGSLKHWVHPPLQPLIRGSQSRDQMRLTPVEPDAPPTVFWGIRPCDLKALEVLDRVFLGNPPDPFYQTYREAAVTVVVQCTGYGETCFCTTVGGSPGVVAGFDLALTEVEGGVLVEVGSPRGASLLEGLESRPAREAEITQARSRVEAVARHLPRRFHRDTVIQALRTAPDHPYWDQVAAQCLGCTNCTLVCPTCFCYTTRDVPLSLGLEGWERQRAWDSCFSLEFAAVHGGNFRPGLRERYRHWVSHKLSYWVEQFETLGCVGCGRCIVWCPVGIDITETARQVAGEASGQRGME